MKTLTVKVKDEVVDYLERLSFEVEGMKKVVKELILDGETNSAILDGEAFKRYEARYSERNAAYEIAKTEMQNTYIPLDLQPLVSSWNLDFATGVLTIVANVDNEYELPNVEEEK